MLDYGYMSKSKFQAGAEILLAIVSCEAAGFLGSLFTAPAIPTWYATLTRPEFAPPSWVFAPVWTTLFALMGIAAWLIWRQGINRQVVKTALAIFALQLGLNILWSGLFFGLQSPGWAFFEIILLWLAIAATIAAFAKLSKPAAWLLAPYLAWVSFAAYLNYAFWSLNT